MDKINNKPVLILNNNPIKSKWPQSNEIDDIDSILKIDSTKSIKEEPIQESDFIYDQDAIQEYNRNEEARLSDISKTVFKAGGVREKSVNVPSPLEPTVQIPAGKVGNAAAPSPLGSPVQTNSVVPTSTTGSVIPTPTLIPTGTPKINIENISFPGADKSKEGEMNELRKKFFDYISPYLDAHHPLEQIAEYLDNSILDAIKDGAKKGSLNGKIISYYPQKGEFISMIAIYSDDRKRPKGFFDEVKKYFDSMMNLAGKPKETPINP